MSCGTFQALQYVDRRERPSIPIPQRCKQNVHVIRHNNDRIKPDSRRECGAGAPARETARMRYATLAQAML